MTTTETATPKAYHTVDKCRVCGHPELTFLYSLGSQHINGFPKPGEDHDVVCPKCPIDIYLCPKCSLVQNIHTAPQELLYSGNYWYRSSVTQTMRDALRNITEQIESMVDLQPGDVVLDIGSNDGTLLRCYADNDIFRLGVEPANNLATPENYEGLRLLHGFWNFEGYENYFKALRGRVRFFRSPETPKAKVITAIGMFYDLDNPNQFIADVAKALRPEGIFCCQLMCLKQMVESMDVGNLAHEHLEFYSLQSLMTLFKQNGLEIFDIYENNVNGGSYRIYCRHESEDTNDSEAAYRVVQALQKEGQMRLFDPETHKTFFQRLVRNRDELVAFIEHEVEVTGRKISVYGASTKGNTLIQWWGLDTCLIDCAAERSPEKYGREMAGSRIPIVSEEEARAMMPDFMLVLPYSFINEMRQREVNELWRCAGGKFLVPLPELRIV